jgi:acyl-coenzyme A synthetase/AMP-(fatty) acid ligase
MTKIATDFASKLAVAFVAVAMIFAAYAPAAQAQSSEDLQQMINDLLAQVAQLQGNTSGGGSSAMSCDSFLVDLGQGDSNASVMKL